MKKVIYLLASVIILSSCTSGLYSHYPRVKNKAHKVATDKEKKKRNYFSQPDVLAQKKIQITAAASPETVFTNPVPAMAMPPSAKKSTGRSIILNFEENEKTKQFFSHKNRANTSFASADENKPIVHKQGRQSLLLSIAGWVSAGLFFIPIIGWGFLAASLVLEIFAMIYGFKAQNEIDKAKKQKDKSKAKVYSNRDEAIAGIVISSVYLGILVMVLMVVYLVAWMILVTGGL